MVNLTRIYTRTGDNGTTALGDFSRTSKTDPRLAAYADVNEANAVIGVVLAAGDLPDDVRAILTRVQNDLFDVGADLCTPLLEAPEYPPLRVQSEWIDELEADCDTQNAKLEKLRSFILPGGTIAAAHLHQATTVVRRSERSTWAAIERHGTAMGTAKGEGGVNPTTAAYLNRLSDLLFILARVANLDAGGDVLWQPGGGRAAAPTKARKASGSPAVSEQDDPTTDDD
ncbi:cob(I)yrinic acid a,c-diamide adenosyltransferase [Knoellia sp. Soil729]|uniref:cob(I)yrinic acid a,c-diamide adenosyltransferase n=1 Tax=Knoellia sp. Soil729 TaxID=1736394 RepID=UPI0006F53E90|nr:cob(I)yrinic acid a,c-diamide adenosyltransferase [Knoellia sp. Soil729]KRE42022.1 cob(I)yrinic acid a c-diamide adenosyltransferase [Knoellia sp. Soil729]